MQDRYRSMVDLQSLTGSAAFEKSMHSSRLAFSSLQTQHGCFTSSESASVMKGRNSGISWVRNGRTFGFEEASEIAGAGGCAIAAAAGTAGKKFRQRILRRVAAVRSAQYIRADTCDPIVTCCAEQFLKECWCRRERKSAVARDEFDELTICLPLICKCAGSFRSGATLRYSACSTRI